MPQRDDDEKLLRQAFAVAQRAREGGDHPFGALLADAHGTVLRQQGNGYSAEGGDRTAHRFGQRRGIRGPDRDRDVVPCLLRERAQ